MRSHFALATIATALIAGSAGCSVHHPVYPVADATKNKVEGIEYSLPKTVVVIGVPVTRTTISKKGTIDAKDQLKKLVGATDEEVQQYTDTKSMVRYKLGTPAMTTVARRDPKETYVIKITGAALEKRELQAKLNTMGFLTESASTAADQTGEFVATTIKSAVTLAALAAGPTPADVTAAVDDLRKSRLAVLTGNNRFTTLSPEALTAVLAQIDAEIAAAVATVLDVSVDVWTAKFEIEFTGAEQANKSPLFETDLLEFSGKQGVNIRANNCIVRAPTPPPGFGFSGSGSAKLSARFDLIGERPVKGADFDGERGYRFRVPAFVDAKVMRTDKGLPVLATELAVAQLGVVRSLPVSPGGGASSYSVTLDELTGALLAVKASSEPINTETVQAGLTAPSLYKDAELAELKRRKEKLEYEKAIYDLKNPKPTVSEGGQ